MATPLPRNRARFSSQELCRLLNGRFLREGPATDAVGVSTDSRQPVEGGVFISLVGDRFDAHRFVSSVLQAEAAVVVVQEDRVDSYLPEWLSACSSKTSLIAVNDTLTALGEVAAEHRRRWGGRIVAITGSVGKTTTKELTAAALAPLVDSEAGGEALLGKTQGNLNNLVGVPHTLLALTESKRYAVIEAGTSVPGEIPRLGEIIAPDVSVVTTVRRSHSAGFPDFLDLVEEKASLFGAARACIVVKFNDENLWNHAKRFRGRLVSWGANSNADVVLLGRELIRREGCGTIQQKVRLSIPTTHRRLEFQATTETIGEGSASAVAMALSAVLALFPDIDEARLARSVEQLSTVAAPPGRFSVLQGSFGGAVIDDSYNASPASMRHALEAASEMVTLGTSRVSDAQGTAQAPDSTGNEVRLFAALGDMLDLGEHEAAEHLQLLQELKRFPLTSVFLLGDAMHAAGESLQSGQASGEISKGSGSPIVLSADVEILVAALQEKLTVGDILLVKGSRGMGMERIVREFSAHPPALAPQPGGAA